MGVTSMQRHNVKSAPGSKVGAPAPTHLQTRSEDQATLNLSADERDALGKVYQLLADVARRAQEQERAA